ncbi:hypothetical protein [Mucilaginibacter aquatilis]|uniref:Uncharacterized protein n=1 Tax=Mucilaginibacter aquatilis TaxID=1517760 RepID=A0A6I4IHT6_9SPHI|nr:hypothetical protein [Mucilaginibacter aquatilis]MVN92919.1 hypothetical protein [Mucilaginibacter aquatilis]
MKTLNTKTQVLLKTIDVELKKLLSQDLAAYRLSQLKNKGINQGNKQAA